MTILGVTIGGVLNIGGQNWDGSHNLEGFEALGNLENKILHEIVEFVVPVIAKAVGHELRLKAIVAASLQLRPNGKLYRIKVKVEAKVDCIWLTKTYEADVFIPFFGPWECKSFHLC